jgi:hypothetical protein
MLGTPRCCSSIRRACGTLLVAAVVALLSHLGTMPHHHPAAEPGLYNQEHDLSTLAAPAAFLLFEGPPCLGVELAGQSPVPAFPPNPRVPPQGLAALRAPPGT